MSSGKVHRQWTEVSLAAITVGVAYSTGDPILLGAVTGGLLGHWITPDIDHHAFTLEEQMIFRLHPLLGHAWMIYWWPYERLFIHRGLSHVILLGTLTRFVYLLWWPLWKFQGQPWLFWLAVGVAWAAQDAVHLLLDRKRKRLRRTPRRGYRVRRRRSLYVSTPQHF